MTERRIAVEPKSGRFESLEEAVVEGGGVVVPPEEAEGLVWSDPAAHAEMPAVLERASNVEWIGLPFAGIEPFVPYLDHDRIWTCAKGVYARPVAEHALMLGLAGLRGMTTYARANRWSAPEGHNLVDGNVVIFGGGGITAELVGLLEPFNCDVTVLRRSSDPFPGATRTASVDDRLDVLPTADLVVLALALTPETAGVMGPAEFDAMADHAWLVNVARGGHVDNDALLAAVRSRAIGGAALDVTEPEPLPEEHPLWAEDRIFITPHIANTPEMGIPLLASHIQENVRRFNDGEDMIGLVDTHAGY